MRLLLLIISVLWTPVASAADPLPSWNDGPLKKELIGFVSETTQPKSTRFVQPEDRIATFDNDGTLWCEVPTVELEFTKVKLAEILQKNPP